MPSSRETEARHDLQEPGAAAAVAASGPEGDHAPVADPDNLRKRSATTCSVPCTVVVARSGVALGDRVLRPAEVGVARDPEGAR